MPAGVELGVVGGAMGGEVAGDLYQRVGHRVPALTRRIAADPLPYAGLGATSLPGEVAEIAAEGLSALLRAVGQRRGPTEAELARARGVAARRAAEGVALEALLGAYHLAGRLGWEALHQEARPEEAGELLAAGTAVLGYLQAVGAAVAAAYLEERQAIYAGEREAHRGLAAALLAGHPAEERAAGCGVRLAPAYLVLALHLGPHPGEAGAAASRHALRRVRAGLEALAGTGVLAALEPGGGTALLPTTAEQAPGMVERLGGAVAELSRAAGVVVTAAAELGATPELARAGRLARELCELAVRLGRPPGLYLLGDLLVEYQLSRPTEAAARLAAVLDPLAGTGELLATLECYLACDASRCRVARALGVHPNTVDYRLRRIGALTGCDPGTTAGAQRLAAALLVRRLARPGVAGPDRGRAD